MPNYLTPFLQTVQAQANIQDTKAQTQQRLMSVMQGQAQLDQQKKESDIMSAWAASQGQGPGGGDSKSAGKVFDQMDDGQMVERNPANPLADTVRSAKVIADRAQARATMLAASGDMKGWAAASKEADDRQKEVRLAQKEVYDDMQRQSKEAAQALGGVRTYKDAQDAIAYIGSQFGDGAAKKAAQQLAKSGVGPNSTPEQMQEAIAPIVNRYATAGEQFTKQSQQVAHQDRLATQAETERYHDMETRDKASSRAISREALSFREGEARARDARRDANDSGKVEDKEQSALSKDPALKNVQSLRKGYESAQSTMDVLKTSGFSSLTGPMVNSLSSEYTQAVNNYRSLVGGKWTEAQRKDFDSAVSKFTGYISSLGTGKVRSPEYVKAVSEEMTRMYQEGNAEALRSTLESKDKVYNRGGNPNNVRSPARLNDAINSGYASVKVDNSGRKFVVIGRDPKKITKEDVYPLRDGPKTDSEIYDTGE